MAFFREAQAYSRPEKKDKKGSSLYAIREDTHTPGQDVNRLGTACAVKKKTGKTKEYYLMTWNKVRQNATQGLTAERCLFQERKAKHESMKIDNPLEENGISYFEVKKPKCYLNLIDHKLSKEELKDFQERFSAYTFIDKVVIQLEFKLHHGKYELIKITPEEQRRFDRNCAIGAPIIVELGRKDTVVGVLGKSPGGKLVPVFHEHVGMAYPLEPPQNVRFPHKDSTSILVQWDEVPQGDQNRVIKGYKVMCTASKSGVQKTKTVSAPTNSLRLRELDKFTEYDISVLAYTAAGDGPASSAMRVKTAEDRPSSPPQNVTARNNGPTSILVQWDEVPQDDQNGVITEYAVLFKDLKSGIEDRKTVNAPTKILELSSLKKSSNYNISVQASTAAGAGPTSDVKKVATPEGGPSFPPQNVTARSNGPTSILVQWDEVPQDDGDGIIKGYDVVFKDLKSGKEDMKRVNAPATRLELSSLEKFRKYDISVLAFTAARIGPASSVLPVMTGEKELDQLRCQLAQFYKENMCRIQVAPWDPDDTVDIDEVYTRLSWSRENKQLSGTKEEKLNDYTDIFLCSKGSANPKRIVVYGQGGIGKSTFTHKLSVDWARGEVEALKKFDLLLVIKLRDVCGEVRDLKEMIVQSGLLPCDEPAQVDCLLKYISENQDRVLILFDGFDEYDKTRDTQSDVYKIITQKMYRGCHVVVTTRPVKLDDLKKFMQAQCKIKGFTYLDIRKFASKYVGKEQCESFMDYLDEHDLEDMASIPLMLLFLCLLWKEHSDQPLPSTRTQLFQGVTQCIIDHCQVKQSPDNLKSIEEYSETLCKIGKVAFEALLQDSLVFDTALLSKEVLSNDIVQLGFLSMSKVQHQRSKLMASFFHKSIQEFLAAWYIAKQPISQWISTLEPLQDFSTVKNFQACLKFVCGLSADGANAVFLHLRKIREKESLVPNCDVARWYLDFDSNQEEFQTLCSTMFLALDCKEAFVGAYLDCVGGVVQFYEDYSFGNATGIKDSVGQLLTLLLRHDSLVQLQFVFDASDPDKMKVKEVFDQVDVRTVTWASGGQSKGSKLLETTTGEQQFLVLRKKTVPYLYYDVSGVSFTPELVRLFQPPASHQSRSEGEASEPENSQEFDIHQQSSAIENELPVHALSFITNARFECVPEDTVLGEILKNAPYLTSLDLSNNPLGAGVSVLASQLENLPKLEMLILNNTEMSEREAGDLSRALVHIPHLTYLLLGSNPLGAGVSVLVSQLENLPKLEGLKLSNTEMSEREAADLSRALVHIPHLTLLDLSSNPFGAGVSVLVSQLENLPKLKKLYLRNTEMSEREAADLSRALVHISHLTELDLDANPLVGRGVICLAEQIVTHVPELQLLSLYNTGMDDECKAALLKAKQDRKKAEGVDLNIDVDGVNGERKYL